MTTETEAVPPKTQSSGEPGWCSWHRGSSEDVRLIQMEDAGSGPRPLVNHRACGPCREIFNLVPLAARP